jgi:hypothetical protein
MMVLPGLGKTGPPGQSHPGQILPAGDDSLVRGQSFLSRKGADRVESTPVVVGPGIAPQNPGLPETNIPPLGRGAPNLGFYPAANPAITPGGRKASRLRR